MNGDYIMEKLAIMISELMIENYENIGSENIKYDGLQEEFEYHKGFIERVKTNEVANEEMKDYIEKYKEDSYVKTYLENVYK